MGPPLGDDDLLLSLADGTWLPVRNYSREPAAQRADAGLKAITLSKLRHSNISRMRAAGRSTDEPRKPRNPLRRRVGADF